MKAEIENLVVYAALLISSLILASIFLAINLTDSKVAKAYATNLNSGDFSPIGSSIVQQGTIGSSSDSYSVNNSNATILMPRTDAIYTGAISWTASKPVDLYILHAYPITSDQAINNTYGQPLTVSISSHLYTITDIASSTAQDGSTVFSGSGLLLASNSGPFIAKYGLRATVDTTTITNDFGNALPTVGSQKIIVNNNIVNEANLTRTIETSSFTVRWSAQTGEEIESLKWSGLPGQELVRVVFPSPLMQCASQLWGDSWAAPDPQSGGKVLVGYSSPPGFFVSSGNTVTLNGTSMGCSPTSQLAHSIGIKDTYQLFNSAPKANTIKVSREFDFSNSNTTVFPQGIFRPYIPRLDASMFSEVLYHTTGVSSTGGNIVNLTIGPANQLYCKFGCIADNWNGGWFALRDPTTGAGVIVKHDYSVDQSGNNLKSKLWLDWDDPAQTATSIALVQPDGGLRGKVTESESFCFFNSSTWNVSFGTLPDGC